MVTESPLSREMVTQTEMVTHAKMVTEESPRT